MASLAFTLLPISSTDVTAYSRASQPGSRRLSLTSAVFGTAALSSPLLPAPPMAFYLTIDSPAPFLTFAPFPTGAASSSTLPPASRTLFLLFTSSATSFALWPTGGRRATPVSQATRFTTSPLGAASSPHAGAHGSQSPSYALALTLPPPPPLGSTLVPPSSLPPGPPRPLGWNSSPFIARGLAAPSAAALSWCTALACSLTAPVALSLPSTPIALPSVLGLLSP